MWCLRSIIACSLVAPGARGLAVRWRARLRTAANARHPCARGSHANSGCLPAADRHCYGPAGGSRPAAHGQRRRRGAWRRGTGRCPDGATAVDSCRNGEQLGRGASGKRPFVLDMVLRSETQIDFRHSPRCKNPLLVHTGSISRMAPAYPAGGGTATVRAPVHSNPQKH